MSNNIKNNAQEIYTRAIVEFEDGAREEVPWPGFPDDLAPERDTQRNRQAQIRERRRFAERYIRSMLGELYLDRDEEISTVWLAS